MNKAFEKILDMLDEMIHPKQLYFCKYARGGCRDLYNDKDCMDCVVELAKEIVQEVAEKYNGGWIPIDEKLPPDDSYILLSFSNYSVPIVGRYEEDEDGGGNFFAGDEDKSLISQDMYVNAWMPLPKPYKEIQYTANNK